MKMLRTVKQLACELEEALSARAETLDIPVASLSGGQLTLHLTMRFKYNSENETFCLMDDETDWQSDPFSISKKDIWRLAEIAIESAMPAMLSEAAIENETVFTRIVTAIDNIRKEMEVAIQEGQNKKERSH